MHRDEGCGAAACSRATLQLVSARQVGRLREEFLESPFSIAEARVLYELAHGDGTTAKELGETLRLDTGYLSRILRSFETQGLIRREPPPEMAVSARFA